MRLIIACRKRCRCASSVIGCALLAVSGVLPLAGSTAEGQESAAGPDRAPAPSIPRDESLTHWQYYVEVSLNSPEESSWYDFLLTPPVFDAARQDLADLRLYADGREVPYALRVREEKSQLANLAAEPFNRLENEDGSRQVSLDFGGGQVQHNEVEILTTGTNFRRQVAIQGSDDRRRWNDIATGYLVDFRRDERIFTDAMIEYPPSRFRYLRVTVRPDRQEDGPREWTVQSVTARRRVDVPGEQVRRSVAFSQREPTRTLKGPGSQWLVDLGGTSVPCRELLVEIESDDFVRDWRIEAAGPDRPGVHFYYVASGVWQRKAGEDDRIFEAKFPHEIRAARLRLEVTDYRNPPLVIAAMASRAPARQVVLEASQPLKAPVRLYFGNPQAEEPRYDFARNLPDKLSPPPRRLELGARKANPVYRPRPKPLTERFPWLVHSVLACAVVVLAALIADLGRVALRDAASSGASEAE